MLAAMPLMTTLSATVLLWVLRSPLGALRWWLAGAVLGLGVYSYTAYVAWPAIVAALLCCYAVLERDRTRQYAAAGAVLAISFVLSTLRILLEVCHREATVNELRRLERVQSHT